MQKRVRTNRPGTGRDGVTKKGGNTIMKQLLIFVAVLFSLIAIMPHRIFTGFMVGILLTAVIILIIKIKL